MPLFWVKIVCETFSQFLRWPLNILTKILIILVGHEFLILLHSWLLTSFYCNSKNLEGSRLMFIYINMFIHLKVTKLLLLCLIVNLNGPLVCELIQIDFFITKWSVHHLSWQTIFIFIIRFEVKWFPKSYLTGYLLMHLSLIYQEDESTKHFIQNSRCIQIDMYCG